MPALVQSVIDNQASAQTNSPTVTWPAATTAGNLLVLMICADGGIGFAPAPNPPTGWTLAGDAVYIGTTDLAGFVYYKENAASQSGTVTVPISAVVNVILALAEVSGIKASGALDGTVDTFDVGGIGLTATTAGIVTTNAVDFLVGWFGFFETTAMTDPTSPTNGFSLEKVAHTDNASFRWSAAFSRKVVLATGTYSTAVTQNKSGATWFAMLVPFKSDDNTIKRRAAMTAWVG